jgi:hypothetical protein
VVWHSARAAPAAAPGHFPKLPVGYLAGLRFHPDVRVIRDDAPRRRQAFRRAAQSGEV